MGRMNTRLKHMTLFINYIFLETIRWHLRTIKNNAMLIISANGNLAVCDANYQFNYSHKWPKLN